MTIKAQIPTVVAVGNRFTYTAPSGLVAHYEVRKTDVISRNGTPGCVRLAPLEPGWGVVTIRPEGLASSYGWARDQTRPGAA